MSSVKRSRGQASKLAFDTLPTASTRVHVPRKTHATLTAEISDNILERLVVELEKGGERAGGADEIRADALSANTR